MVGFLKLVKVSGEFKFKTLRDEKPYTQLSFDGWECKIYTRHNGKPALQFVYENEFDDNSNRRRFFVDLTNGFYVDSLNGETLKKGYLTKKGTSLENGQFGLSNGSAYERYVYFRPEKLISWLKVYGINAIEHMSPNGEFYGLNYHNSTSEATFTVETDGEVIYKEVENGIIAIVTKATWTIAHSYQHSSNRHSNVSILYTKKNIKTLSLPKKE